MAILGLLKHLGGRVAGGELLFQSDVLGRQVNLGNLSERELRKVRGNEIAMIFQEPMTSLNPVYTIGSQMGETLALHQDLSRGAARRKALEFLDVVRLPNAKRLLDNYPHQLSGGMRQRVMIAIDLPPGIRAIANWNFPPLNGRRRKTHEAEAFHRRANHQCAEGERGRR
uniref:ATP-binding cassette domain-containing protein n=1 Tax=Puniceibacterium confluentis TaxID=1958944 RepID=UPI00356A8881